MILQFDIEVLTDYELVKRAEMLKQKLEGILINNDLIEYVLVLEAISDRKIDTTRHVECLRSPFPWCNGAEGCERCEYEGEE